MTNLICLRTYVVTVTLVFSWATLGHADDDVVTPNPQAAQSNVQINDVTPKKKSNTTDDAAEVDEMITNNNLRALSGSTSKWSIASIFDYLGGTLVSPLSEDRPNISDGSGNTDKADLDGNINIKYNINAKNSLLLGIGIRWIAPLKPGGPTNYNGTTFDAINPTFTYQHIYKWAGVQSVFQASFQQWTQADYTALGYDKQYQLSQENMYQVPGTKFSIGGGISTQYQTFNKSGSFGSVAQGNYIADLRTAQSQYMFSFVPEFEYQISTKVNLRTVINLWTYEHYMSQSDLSVYQQDEIYQSVGIGYSVTRDIFLYPNVQFIPSHLEASLTNVGITATINLF
jgi:hypothetical protein